MSRRVVLAVAAAVVCLYVCVIVVVLAPPLHGPARRRGALGPAWCRELRWLPADGARPVALASFPGSGNTWLRYLLQQATGVVTGSVYLDHSLREHGFPGEGCVTSRALVVKTHDSPVAPTAPAPYRAAVLLVRHPRDALIADFNRLHKGHVGTAPWQAFLSTATGHGTISWTEHVRRGSLGWQRFHRAWLRVRVPRLVVTFEQLAEDTRRTLAAVLSFLNYTDQETMDCAMERKEGIYRRRRRLRLDPFSARQTRRLDRVYRALLLRAFRPRPGHPPPAT